MGPRYVCSSLLAMRIKLIKEIIEGKRKIIEVADILSVSRQSVSKWIAKYHIEWEAGIVPKKCWPRGWIPVNRTDTITEKMVICLAKQYPLFWPVFLRMKLIETEGIILDQSTVYRILRRNGVRYKDRWEWRRKRKTLYVLDTPWREVQVDACFPFGRRRREVQYDAIDDCSRFVFSRLHTEHCVRSSMEFVYNLIHTAPFRIKTVRTDQWMEFWPGFTEFLKKLWIEHKRNAPYSPQHNGKVERYHRTLWRGLGEFHPNIDAHEYRYKLKLFEDWYNYQKPHNGLWMFGMTPAEKIGYCLVQDLLNKDSLANARESEDPWGLKEMKSFFNVNLTLQFNKSYGNLKIPDCVKWSKYRGYKWQVSV